MLTIYNDHKEKDTSYMVAMDDQFEHDIESKFFKQHPYTECGISGGSIRGYGATKEEAIDNFRTGFRFLMSELKNLEHLYLETDFLEMNLVEVDCIGNPIKEKNKENS